MIDDVRLALRIMGDDFDTEIANLIAACKKDLQRAGIVKFPDDDPLILQAVILYGKGYFGFADISEKYVAAYESLRNALCLAGDYNVE
ncbi:MAG: head-tail connector protein [Defluviitaleaceae bacterium]|nr:head-tail connector protein [Defluviitaleaceae bacterium]